MPGDDRPRNICPGSSNKHGAATYLQNIAHEALRKNMPGYIQAYTKDGLRDFLINNVNEKHICHSMDGSAFESTQHISLMKIVDDRLYHMLA